MATRTLAQPFDGYLTDAAIGGPPFNMGRTPGCYLIDAIPITPPVQKAWTIQSVSITALLSLWVNIDGTVTNRPWGRFGKIIGGIAPNTGPTTIPAPFRDGPAPNQGVTGVYQPSDMSLVGTLWDPAADDLPPLVDSPSNPIPMTGLPISTTINPPAPPVLPAGILGVFIAMQPSIVNNCFLNILQQVPAVWSITYTDDTTLT